MKSAVKCFLKIFKYKMNTKYVIKNKININYCNTNVIT